MEFKIPVKDKTKAVLKLLNPFLSYLSDREISIIACMIDSDIDILSKENRVIVREKLNIDKFNFNNCISRLKKKGVLIQSTIDLCCLNPQLRAYTNDTVYTIEFVNG